MKTDGAIKQIDLYRQMSGPERLRIGCELYDLAKEIITANVRRMFPNLTDQERQEKVKERMSLVVREANLYDTK